MSLQDQLLEISEQSIPDSWTAISRHLPPQWIEDALSETGVATVRKRRLPMEQVIWLVLGIALMRDRSIADVASRLDIALPGKVLNVAPSALAQARQRLGASPLKWLFETTAARWGHSETAKHRWRGLALYALDGTIWRTPDTADNRGRFGGPTNQHDVAVYPQVRMACLLGVRSRLVVAASFGAYATGETTLAQSLLPQLPEHSLLLVDKGFYSAALLLSVQQKSGQHWLIPMRANARGDIIHTDGEGDVRLLMRVSPQARKKEPELPRHWEARAITRTLPNGQQRTVLTSLTDAKQWPADEVFNLYRERWEIELAYGELKTEQLQRAAVLRSQLADGVEQELWATLLMYNLIRLEMVRMAEEAKVAPYRISFIHALRFIQDEWLWCAVASPGSIPAKLQRMRNQLKQFILPERRPQRLYPRVIKTPQSPFATKGRCAKA